MVQRLWPNAQLKLFGSFLSGLALANSDIDMMVVGATGQSPMKLLASELQINGIPEPNTIHIRNVPVPIILFIDRESKINIDIPFASDPALRVATIYSKYQSKYPVLVKIILVLKQYLKQLDLNYKSTGGISSYALTVMCISYLQRHPTYKAHENANLGELLLGFFELYGRKFDYESIGITIENDGKYLPPRKDLPCSMDNINRELFCIEDPVNHTMNICDHSYRAYDVKKAFENGFVTLSTAISSNQNSSTNECKPSLLGSIVHISDDLIKMI